MAAGHVVGSACVDVATSADAFFSTIAPATTPGLVTYYSQASKESGVWYLKTYANGTLVTTSPLTAPAFASCDTTANFFDGLALGWAVVAAMVAAYAVHLLRRAL